jgi:hypothetical protein
VRDAYLACAERRSAMNRYVNLYSI